ncbi:hypothetical protein VB264_23480 [Arcicella aquatica]|uniref:ABC-2 type transport system permease protein n=1 Tax=Arcicella aquatica TaxID=217141 RepID=A0ABU5QWS4_9BACT|nr:hypothetical protein [Arcicella aquatica]MEA5260781.1 hypothetical protein [Arcicella aquatica]
MTKFILRILDKLQWLFKWLSVDYPTLRAIVEVKLIAENRRSHGLQRNQQQKKEQSNTFLKSLLLQAFFSLLYGLMILFIKQPVYLVMMLSFAFIMFMVAFNMISDFAEVLFDTSDNVILLPRPVDGKVIWMARLIHIIVFLGALTLANSFGSIIFTAYKFGWQAGVLFVGCVVLLCLITIFLTSILYLLLTKVVSEEKLKDIIGYAQIAFSVFLAVGYQFIARTDKLIGTSTQEIVIKWWHYITPPAWFAGVMEAFIEKHFELPYIIFSVLVLIVPFAALYIMNNYLSPLFAKSLSGLGTPSIIEDERQKAAPKNNLLHVLSKVFTKTTLEKSAFELVWIITARDRKFKVRAYPIFGMLIYFMYNFFTQTDKEAFNVLMVLYYAMFIIWIFSQQIYISDDWKAAWAYRVAPLVQPGEILLGGLKAVLVKVGIPVYIIIGAVVIYKSGFGMIDDILFAMASTLLFISLNVFGGDFSLPFSIEVVNGKVKGSQWMKFLFLFFVAPILGFLHFFIAKTTYGLIALTPILLIIALLLLKEYRKISWERIKDGL